MDGAVAVDEGDVMPAVELHSVPPVAVHDSDQLEVPIAHRRPVRSKAVQRNRERLLTKVVSVSKKPDI